MAAEMEDQSEGDIFLDLAEAAGKTNHRNARLTISLSGLAKRQKA
jgi:hypothetical protein